MDLLHLFDQQVERLSKDTEAVRQKAIQLQLERYQIRNRSQNAANYVNSSTSLTPLNQFQHNLCSPDSKQQSFRENQNLKTSSTVDFGSLQMRTNNEERLKYFAKQEAYIAEVNAYNKQISQEIERKKRNFYETQYIGSDAKYADQINCQLDNLSVGKYDRCAKVDNRDEKHSPQKMMSQTQQIRAKEPCNVQAAIDSMESRYLVSNRDDKQDGRHTQNDEKSERILTQHDLNDEYYYSLVKTPSKDIMSRNQSTASNLNQTSVVDLQSQGRSDRIKSLKQSNDMIIQQAQLQRSHLELKNQIDEMMTLTKEISKKPTKKLPNFSRGCGSYDVSQTIRGRQSSPLKRSPPGRSNANNSIQYNIDLVEMNDTRASQCKQVPYSLNQTQKVQLRKDIFNSSMMSSPNRSSFNKTTVIKPKQSLVSHNEQNHFKQSSFQKQRQSVQLLSSPAYSHSNVSKGTIYKAGTKQTSKYDQDRSCEDYMNILDKQRLREYNAKIKRQSLQQQKAKSKFQECADKVSKINALSQQRKYQQEYRRNQALNHQSRLREFMNIQDKLLQKQKQMVKQDLDKSVQSSMHKSKNQRQACSPHLQKQEQCERVMTQNSQMSFCEEVQPQQQQKYQKQMTPVLKEERPYYKKQKTPVLKEERPYYKKQMTPVLKEERVQRLSGQDISEIEHNCMSGRSANSGQKASINERQSSSPFSILKSGHKESKQQLKTNFQDQQTSDKKKTNVKFNVSSQKQLVQQEQELEHYQKIREQLESQLLDVQTRKQNFILETDQSITRL